MFSLFIAPALLLLASFIKIPRQILPLLSAAIFLPILWLFEKGDMSLWHENFLVDGLGRFVLLLSAVVGVGVTFALESLQKRSAISEKEYVRFYRFFAIFWIGLILSIIANNMGIFWVGLELATLSTVYMIKTNPSRFASHEAWNYMIVGTIAISLILFGIILIYASAKGALGEEAMHFSALLSHHEVVRGYLFEIGFAFVAIGMFIKMGFFPMNIWLANIERASYYPVAALFSGLLESAVMIGFFRFSLIAQKINFAHLIGFGFIYALLTLFIVAFLIYRVKDFMRFFSLSGIEHMVLVAIFWASGGYFAALLHLAGHAFIKPALFIGAGIMESWGRYHFAGALKGFRGLKGKIFVASVASFMLAIIALPPSPLFFSELYGFGAMIDLARDSHHLLLMLGAIALIALLLAIIFYKFVEVYQAMLYKDEEKEMKKEVSLSEAITFVIFIIATASLLLPQSLDFIRSIV